MAFQSTTARDRTALGTDAMDFDRNTARAGTARNRQTQDWLSSYCGALALLALLVVPACTSNANDALSPGQGGTRTSIPALANGGAHVTSTAGGVGVTSASTNGNTQGGSAGGTPGTSAAVSQVPDAQSAGGTSSGGSTETRPASTATSAGKQGQAGAATGGSRSVPTTTATGGSVSSGGGVASGGVAAAGGVASGGVAAAQAGAATVDGVAGATSIAVSKLSEGQLALSGLTIVSYGGYLNGESFQQDGIVTFGGYQYTAFWNTNRHVVMARRKLPSGAWAKFEFTDYTNSEDDAHNTISLGVCPGDGTLHLAFDHHSSDLHYRRSAVGFLTSEASAWDATSFGSVTNSLVGSTKIPLLTYPRFLTEPGGSKVLFSARTGTSGSGDEELWEYDSKSHTWLGVGKYIDGITDSVNAYLHGLAYSPTGTRLHATWCWRETPDATTNHDLFYVYSDDNGRTWKSSSGNTVGVTGSTYITKDSASARVWTIGQNRGLINQEHMAVDAKEQVHVLLSHMPDAQSDDSDFTKARTKSIFYHYWRNANGSWTRTPINLPVIQNFRGKLAISSRSNVYAILPDLRIAGASSASNYSDWALLTADDAGRFFSDPLIDTSRLAVEDRLTVYYPQKSSVNIWALDYSIR
jgi:hypothetical protein